MPLKILQEAILKALKALKKPAIFAILIGLLLINDPTALDASGGRMGGRSFSRSSTTSSSRSYSVSPSTSSGFSFSVPYYAPTPFRGDGGFLRGPRVRGRCWCVWVLLLGSFILVGVLAFLLVLGFPSDRYEGVLAATEKTNVLKLQVKAQACFAFIAHTVMILKFTVLMRVVFSLLDLVTLHNGRDSWQQMSAAAFAKGLLDLEGQLTPILVSLVSKDSSMLDGLDNASIEMEEAKARLNEIITGGAKTVSDHESPEFPWMTDGAGLPSNAFELLSKLVELTKKVTEQVRLLAKDEDEELAETSSFDVISPYDQAKALGKTNIDSDRIAAGLPCGSEGFLLMYARWRKLERDLYNERKVRFDITQIPDVYDSCKYDLLHNAHLKLEGLGELFKVAQVLADGVIPNEYGINPRQKLKIGSKIARRLLGKILIDLRNTREEAISVAKLKTTQDHPATSEKTENEETDHQPKFFIKVEDMRRTSTASEVSIDQDEDDDKETKYRLDPKYANVRTPDRHVRTRLYFTSESHIHSLMNVLRYCNLDETLQEEDSLVCYSALERLFKTRELDYMSYIVLRMFENTEVALEDPKRFRIEMTFSRGADLSPLEKNNSEAASLHQEHTLPIMGPERLQDMGSYLTLEKMEKMVRPFAMPAEDFPPPSIPAGFSGYFSKSAAVLERLVNLWPFHKQEKHAATNGK